MFVSLAALLWAFVSPAASLSTNYTLYLPGVQKIIIEPGHVFQGMGGPNEPDPNTNVTVFRIPRIDPAKFTITDVSFKFTCYIGGAVWGYHDPVSESLNAGVTTVVAFGPGSLLANNVQGKSAPYSASSTGFSVHYDAVRVYDTNRMGQLIGGGNFYTVFNGFTNGPFFDLPAQINVEALSDIYVGNPPSYTKGPASALVFWSNIKLEVRYDLETIGNANAGNLPVPPPPGPPGFIWQQSLTNQATLVPPDVDLPDFVLRALAMSVTDVTRTNQDVRITWRTAAGSTNYVQAGSSLSSFSDLSGPIVVPGSNAVTTASFVDVGGATNGPARYYRIRLTQ